jgi:NAD(P)-dependent dehydrogenase (short-subunit alcohol dehydrogenase family)
MPRSHNPHVLYSQSKLANVLFTRALAKRLADQPIYVNCLHPGVVNTEILRGVQSFYGAWATPIIAIVRRFFMSANNGSLTTLYAATSPEIEEKNYRGEYFVPYGQLGKASADALNGELAERLWRFTEKLIEEKDIE